VPPRLGVFKFASCDGCQLSLLDCEDELLGLAAQVEVAYFLEATRQPLVGEFDVALVEGSISAPEQLEQIHDVRQRSRFLVAIGACATAGGIQALRNGADVNDFLRLVYARPEYIQTLATSTPLAAHVQVDFELRGCPIDKRQLVDTIVSLLAGRRPRTPNHAVCLECKRAGHVCVMVAHGTPCLGPVTHAGCGALCPGYDRGCYGCFGPAASPNVTSLSQRLSATGFAAEAQVRLLSTFNVAAPAFASGRVALPVATPA
jgi:coenzyme F420-reducing hydrogenase gamma subunit